MYLIIKKSHIFIESALRSNRTLLHRDIILCTNFRFDLKSQKYEIYSLSGFSNLCIFTERATTNGSGDERTDLGSQRGPSACWTHTFALFYIRSVAHINQAREELNWKFLYIGAYTVNLQLTHNKINKSLLCYVTETEEPGEKLAAWPRQRKNSRQSHPYCMNFIVMCMYSCLTE